MAAKLISTGLRHTTLPENYVRLISDRPRLSEVSELKNFPLIDLSSTDRSLLVQQIHQACSQFGFFEVINHGVSKQIIEEMVSVANEFFNMSMEEKMKLYSDDPTKTIRLSTSFNVKKEVVNNWRDYLRLHCYPIDKYVHEWPSNPPSFREIVSKYSREVREVGFKIEDLISESLGLEKDYMKKVLAEQGQHMAVNYYPQCISKFGDILWSDFYAKMEAKLQHHGSGQFLGDLSSSAGIPIRTSWGKNQLSLSYEKLFPRRDFLDGALYLTFQDRKPNQLAPGDGNQLALPSIKEAEEVFSLPLPETVISHITDIIDRSTTHTGFARKFSDLIVLLIGFCGTVLSVCGLVYCRLRQSMRIKEPNVSEVPTAISKKKKPKKNGTIKAVHKKENNYISGGNKDPSNEENKKRLLTALPGQNNSSAEGYRVGKLFVSKKEIAKGSNGTVVLEGSYDGRLVAVKRLVQTHHDVAQKEISNLMASDNHPNIVRLYGVDLDEHFIYISLERCACSLNDLIYASYGLLESPMASSSIHSVQINPILEKDKGVELWKENGHPSPVFLKLMRDIVAGLVHLHDIGIVHRDLKPQNVLIVKDSSVCAKLSDMGISKRLPADTSALTRNSTGSGSSGWQAPEQLRNERQTRAVDLFSLGCVLFFCMTGGQHPYGDNYERDINVLNDRKDLFLIESLPEAVHLLSGLLHPDPNLRPRAQEVLHHPLFWNSDMRLSFLRDASDRIELKNREEGSQLLAALESTAAVTFNGRWDEKLDSIFLDNIGRYRRYKFDSIRDLLRVIRNKLNHYRELPKELQELLGSVPEGFDRYFSSRFPKLLIQVYAVLFDYCNSEEFFFKYSKSTVF